MGAFRMPSLGADMDEGTVIEWLVKPGDQVHRGDIVAVVDTAKSAVEVECFETGAVGEILVPAGEKVPVGTPLAMIGAGPAPPPTPPTPLTTPPGGVTGVAAGKSAKPRRPATPAHPPPASPPVRTFAAQAGVDLATVHGTGRGGAITRADVQRAAQSAAAVPAEPQPGRARVSPYARRLAAERGIGLPATPGELVRARDLPGGNGEAKAPPPPAAPAARHDESMRQAIAALMARSKREIPHYYLTATIDLHTAIEWLTAYNRTVPVTARVLPAALLLKAAARAAVRVPELNGHWIDGAFRPAAEVRLGVAVALRGGGLLTPAISGADTLTVPDLMTRLRELVGRARGARLRASDLAEPTITVTNLGDLGVESVHGVIYPPQVALLGFGAVAERPWAVDGLLGVRPLVTATLSADHRASDGAVGARFLHTIDTLLQTPEEL
ncbi:dihydrolipoamide acetyltransferase family protein [Amycolatopsis mongoliensis]|uniref:Dihydrolipoamide acetyltransferase component of pyruvate dehydrogenase complex n=1 Tax=Amycolatopsis mongoliensis TaxID=715475 RepID=A0A9Y2JKW7_9PSEU|nr:dihydrolipoamide acetyltransferase family protein [Amycolatopsis sp. 4-36]WIY00506.1 dihydrolipoamide acetyltransferase family protein [Amycolatopsis sp. 4-36]